MISIKGLRADYKALCSFAKKSGDELDREAASVAGYNFSLIQYRSESK